MGMIQNLGEKAEAELVKLYQQIYTRGTRGKIADYRHYTEKAKKLVWTYPTLLRTAIEGRMIGKQVAGRPRTKMIDWMMDQSAERNYMNS